MGDLPALALARVFAGAVFLGFFAKSPGLGAGAGAGLNSDSTSSGELVVVADIPLSHIVIGSAWA